MISRPVCQSTTQLLVCLDKGNKTVGLADGRHTDNIEKEKEKKRCLPKLDWVNPTGILTLEFENTYIGLACYYRRYQNSGLIGKFSELLRFSPHTRQNLSKIFALSQAHVKQIPIRSTEKDNARKRKAKAQIVVAATEKAQGKPAKNYLEDITKCWERRIKFRRRLGWQWEAARARQGGESGKNSEVVRGRKFGSKRREIQESVRKIR